MNTPGQRISRQREVILQELCALKCHPTADELYERVRRVLPRISLGTVYRNLELLTETGVIQKLGPGERRRFDGNVRPHPHVRCLACGRVDDIGPNLPPPSLHEAECMGYHITGCNIEFTGVCLDCRLAGKDSSGDRTAFQETQDHPI